MAAPPDHTLLPSPCSAQRPDLGPAALSSQSPMEEGPGGSPGDPVTSALGSASNRLAPWDRGLLTGRVRGGWDGGRGPGGRAGSWAGRPFPAPWLNCHHHTSGGTDRPEPLRAGRTEVAEEGEKVAREGGSCVLPSRGETATQGSRWPGLQTRIRAPLAPRGLSLNPCPR